MIEATLDVIGFCAFVFAIWWVNLFVWDIEWALRKRRRKNSWPRRVRVDGGTVIVQASGTVHYICDNRYVWEMHCDDHPIRRFPVGH